jgi:hypothetical protein
MIIVFNRCVVGSMAIARPFGEHPGPPGRILRSEAGTIRAMLDAILRRMSRRTSPLDRRLEDLHGGRI